MRDRPLPIFGAFVVLTLLASSACTGSKHTPPMGTGGAAGSGEGGRAGGAATMGAAGGDAVGGAAATGGTGIAGAVGTTGVAGTTGEAGGGTAGAAGTTGTGGSSGMSGAAGSGAECTKAEDCALLSDCCACRAEPKGAVLPNCAATCTQDSCAANQIQPHEVTCVFGRCVIARSCNTARVTCLADPVDCPSGTVHSVLDSCWGPCLPPTECRDVTDCSSCGAGVACVRNIEFAITTSCVAPAADCHAGSYCGCLVTCPVLCGETDAGVSCFCPGC